jgi:hypothetical protein
MMKQETKLTQKQEVEQQAKTQAAHEFANSDELLRADAAQTIIPPEVEERLKKSATRLAPPPARPWWKNLLGR